MSAYDGTVDQCLLDCRVNGAARTLSDSPLCCRIVLRLNCAELRHDINRLLEPGQDQTLISQSLPRNVREIYAAATSNLNLRPNSRRRSSMLTASAV